HAQLALPHQKQTRGGDQGMTVVVVDEEDAEEEATYALIITGHRGPPPPPTGTSIRTLALPRRWVFDSTFDCARPRRGHRSTYQVTNLYRTCCGLCPPIG